MLGIDLCDALEHLHAQQLIHRDIKPSSIIFVNGAPKFGDVGLVTAMVPDGETATLIGTEGYIAPEGPGTALADIYSLGKVLYEACTGQDRRNFPALSASLLQAGDSQVAALNEIILKACDPQPSGRYKTAAELRLALAAMKAS